METSTQAVLSGTYVLDLAPDVRAELDAAEAAYRANPDDVDAKIAFRMLEGQTFRALEIDGDVVRLVGQGRIRTLAPDEVEIERRADGALDIEWLLTGDDSVAREVVR
ncbi:MAG: hypothetical protein GY898_10600 [Proteobacteria bacterium]|nr:hypothetical protein [Pseudomonadota bacterium]